MNPNDENPPAFPTLEEMRVQFEEVVRSSPRLSQSTPLGIMEINGLFAHYMHPDTDTMWIGFGLGYRKATAMLAARKKVQP